MKAWLDMNKSMTIMDVSSILLTMDLFLTISPTSVDNKFCFSQHKLIKTNRYHWMCQEHLNSVMSVRIKVLNEEASIGDFDPDLLEDHWMVSS